LYGIDSAIACGEKNDKRQSLVNGNIKKEGKSLNNSKTKKKQNESSMQTSILFHFDVELNFLVIRG